MGNGKEEGDSNSESQHPILPGVFKMNGIWVRWIDGTLFKVTSGEDFVKQINEVDSKCEDEIAGPGRSFFQDPLSIIPEGKQSHTRINPQSPDKI